jgi:hypothetical protein
MFEGLLQPMHLLLIFGILFISWARGNFRSWEGDWAKAFVGSGML